MAAKQPVSIDLKPVDSSNIEAIGHDAGSQTLRIRFRSGGTYDYCPVTAQQASQLAAAESIGTHFHKHIRTKHVGMKVA